MKLYISIIVFLLFELNAQDGVCIPDGLNTTSADNAINLEWQSIDGTNDSFDLLFECFEFCGIPNNTSIEHSSNNGNGGWYRFNDGQYYCAWGYLCDLTGTPQDGFAGVAWSGSENANLQSRMIFGPFETPSDYNLALTFMELYWDESLGVDNNYVEVSINQGVTWETIYTSIPTDNPAETWVNKIIDISNYSGQTILISFTYNANGLSENWAVDQVVLNANNIVDENRSLSGLWEETPEIVKPETSLSSIPENRTIKKVSKSLNKPLWTTKEEYNRIDKKDRYKVDNRKIEIPNFSTRKSDVFNILNSSRNCDDPENYTEINITCTSGSWPSEITWSLQDSISGETLIEGIAPFDTSICVINGWYNLIAVDSYGDGWNGAVLTITDYSGSQILNLENVSGTGGTFPFYIGPIYGCTNAFAENYDENANTDDGSCEFLPCELNRTLFYLNPGLWSSEVSWSIKDSLGNVLTNGIADEFKRLCLDDGEYKALGFDSYGDGWNGGRLFAFDTAFSQILSWSLDEGSEDSTVFYVGPIYGCTDINADNYDPLATVDDGSCEYLNCFDNLGYITYLDGDSVDFATSNSYLFNGLSNGTEYELGVSAVYAQGVSDIQTIKSVPWNNVMFNPLIMEMDTVTNDNFLYGSLNFSVGLDYLYTTQFRIRNQYMPLIDYSNNLIYAGFNESNFTSFFDPSGLFGGLWQIGDQNDASSTFFEYDESPDSTTFAWINDDSIGAGGGSESAYLISEPVQISEGEKAFISMDLFFPQSFGSCSEGDTDGEGFGEDLFLMISDDYGDNWIIIDSTMGGYNYWNTQIYDISHHLNGIEDFIAALYYTDCNGNWALGVGVDNFVIKVADPDETIFINPMSGWIDAGEELSIDIKISNDNQNFNDTELQLEAAFESLSIPLYFGASLGNESYTNLINPSQFQLKQNYPNPFNPNTQIGYTLPREEYVTLLIFDILGREVITLVDEMKSPGYLSVNWNGLDNLGNNCGAGMYFYHLTAGNFSQTKKMVLLK